MGARVKNSNDDVTLTLTPAEALVLFELLARLDTSGLFAFEDDAEQKVLWRISGQLETVLIEPLAPDYRELLDRARKVVRGT